MQAGTMVLCDVRLADAIAELSPAESAAGRRARTLLKHDQLRVVLVTMRAGAELHEHRASGTISIHALAGHFSVHASGSTHPIRAGQLIALAPDIPHSVTAVEEGAFLLTIAWSATNSEPDQLT
jgi:quercetin dioxygenase-like cupin family protein